MIFDTHAHYLDARFDEDRQDVISSLHDNNVAYAVEVSAGVDDFYDIISLTEKYPFMYGTIGVHPSEVDKLNDEWLHKMEELAANDKIVAIGEIGLDYHFDDDPEPTVQKMWFKKQIELARKVNLPLIIHSRDSAKDTLDILKETDAGKTGGVIHCFSYSKEIALECVDMGFYIGLDGPVTFKNGKKAKEVAKAVPIERLVVDCIHTHYLLCIKVLFISLSCINHINYPLYTPYTIRYNICTKSSFFSLRYNYEDKCSK